MTTPNHQAYWDAIAAAYQRETRIAVDDFHYGPLLPGDRKLGLLPPVLRGLRCLELACGGGQNSLYLASRGAECEALDISGRLLAQARALARAHGLSIQFRRCAMESLRRVAKGPYDLVHSAFGLCFAADPAKVIHDAATCMRPGARMVLSTVHPLYTGEWVSLDDEAPGVFLTDYFHPAADVRTAAGGGGVVQRAYPVGLVTEWLRAAGLRLLRLLEPEPLPIPAMDAKEIETRVPYYSRAWRRLYPRLARVPATVIYVAGLDPAC